ncbi:hypothetical protein LAZ67_1002591 [Cordylochernes scorpioides]|uniref:Mos1 transposase HTH domain-containing protein n=1 Tax=Cordylochernes scorpioides TaxID=51811 RepID=A0ABY6JWZ2_9ARAC|nr:hypothetical protein LAZ67_1002591 [Cordylochernes scorpioides]
MGGPEEEDSSDISGYHSDSAESAAATPSLGAGPGYRSRVLDRLRFLPIKKMDHRTCIKFCVKNEIKCADAFRMLTVAYGEATLDRSNVYRWYKMFSEGREDVNDEERAGRPSTSTTDEKINEVEKMILANRRITVREVAEDLNISIGSCHSIFINDLGMRRVAAKFVPKLLNCDQKQHRMNIANEMLDSVRDDPNLLQRVITGDEAWVYGYDVETKAQSSQWKLPHEPRPKKARQVRSNVKVFMTVFFDCRGVVHHEFLPQGRTVNKEYYLQVMRNLREAIRQKRPDLWKNKNWLLHHDNAPAHTSLLVRDFLAKNNTLMMPQPPYSPDLTPCDFFLFPKLKRPMKGRSYATLDEIKTASKEELKKIFKNDFLKCFEDWTGKGEVSVYYTCSLCLYGTSTMVVGGRQLNRPEKVALSRPVPCPSSETVSRSVKPVIVDLQMSPYISITAIAMSTILVSVYGEECMSIQMVRRWRSWFLEGWQNVHDDERSGSPVTATDNAAVAVVRNVVEADRRVTIDEIIIRLPPGIEIKRSSIGTIMSDVLDFRKVCARWVARLLLENHKQQRMEAARVFLEMHQRDGDQLFSRIVTGDESWVHHSTPETKRQSMVWKKPEESAPKKAKVTISAGKVMAMENFKWEIFTHPPHFPELAPSDFHLYPALKWHPGGKHFANDDEVQAEANHWLLRQETACSFASFFLWREERLCCRIVYKDIVILREVLALIRRWNPGASIRKCRSQHPWPLLATAEPGLRRRLAGRRRALERAARGLGRHGLVATADDRLVPLHEALRSALESAVGRCRAALQHLEGSASRPASRHRGPAPSAASHQRQLALRSPDIQARLARNKAALDALEAALAPPAPLLRALHRRVELDKDALVQFSQLRRDALPGLPSAEAAVAPVLLRFSQGCSRVLALMGGPEEEDSSDISGYHSDSAESAAATPSLGAGPGYRSRVLDLLRFLPIKNNGSKNLYQILCEKRN